MGRLELPRQKISLGEKIITGFMFLFFAIVFGMGVWATIKFWMG